MQSRAAALIDLVTHKKSDVSSRHEMSARRVSPRKNLTPKKKLQESTTNTNVRRNIPFEEDTDKSPDIVDLSCPASSFAPIATSSPTQKVPTLTTSSPMVSSAPLAPTLIPSPLTSLASTTFVTISSTDSTSIAPASTTISLTDTTSIASNSTTSYLSTTINRIWLKALLQKSQPGRLILLFHKDKGYLSSQEQASLTNILIMNELDEDPTKVISTERFRHLAKAICSLFTSECETDYFIPAAFKTTPMGRLYDKFRNYRRKLRGKGLIKGRAYCSNVKKAQAAPVIGDEAANEITWLKNNADPWEDVVLKFKSTTAPRVNMMINSKKDIETYFKLYPGLRSTKGHLLISNDFDNLHPEEANALLSNWDDLEVKIISLANRSCERSENFGLLLTSLGIDLTRNEPQVVTANALLFLPVIFPSIMVKGKWKPSKKEQQDGFILRVSSDLDVKQKLDDRKQKLATYGIKAPAIPVVVGEIGENENYFVYINEICYECPTLIKAVDICFKIYYSLKKPFPEDSPLPWNYICKHVYKLHTGKTYPKVETLVSTLQKLA